MRKVDCRLLLLLGSVTFFELMLLQTIPRCMEGNNENAEDKVLTTKSFTEGFVVLSNESISAVLREAGYRAVTTRRRGNGPVLEFAALKEDDEPFKPV